MSHRKVINLIDGSLRVGRKLAREQLKSRFSKREVLKDFELLGKVVRGSREKTQKATQLAGELIRLIRGLSRFESRQKLTRGEEEIRQRNHKLMAFKPAPEKAEDPVSEKTQKVEEGK